MSIPNYFYKSTELKGVGDSSSNIPLLGNLSLSDSGCQHSRETCVFCQASINQSFFKRVESMKNIINNKEYKKNSHRISNRITNCHLKIGAKNKRVGRFKLGIRQVYRTNQKIAEENIKLENQNKLRAFIQMETYLVQILGGGLEGLDDKELNHLIEICRQIIVKRKDIYS
ncbi:hypothetical protein DFA_07768 [Cavenderia fasciculata]|uniref:Uncharacterized protein n=1 Tax=Cavenderia fasciculata TaxID=261658 RepID=F4Q368_CACFS|nr:uncharacterized protein DFA_07768 [Cavenderia fasciculata]EGG16790.1 hypothetical protein DFA_07768 [Cavenderia fasciculata]|eukprot:XP_004355264.1 hypothetical protein DFA_07768 [Cavenderia fasciculata]